MVGKGDWLYSFDGSTIKVKTKGESISLGHTITMPASHLQQVGIAGSVSNSTLFI